MSRVRALAWLSLVAALLAARPADALTVDPASSEAGFYVVTRWGEVVRGRFPVLEGELTRLPDGRQRVRVSLSTADAEIVGSRRHTTMSRGRGFFDAERHPWATFESEPFDDALLVDGGELPGLLHLRDVQRRETFAVEPSGCARPMLDCPVLATGTIDRSRYGMNRWGVVLGAKVRFQLLLRARGANE